MRKEAVHGWQDLIDRVDAFVHPEHGCHAPKMIQGIANGWKTCEEVDRSGCGSEDEEAWVKAAALCALSFEGPAPLWIAGAGFDETWKAVPPRN